MGPTHKDVIPIGLGEWMSDTGGLSSLGRGKVEFADRKLCGQILSGWRVEW